MFQIYQIDAFTNDVFGGNPAAVVPLKTWIPDAYLQKIAAENNLSETAFYVEENEGYRLRWFTPVAEVDLCGHATLAAAAVMFCGFVGGVLGGLVSDGLLRSGYSLTLARKLPIVVGMLLASCIVLSIYVESDSAVIALMALAFFGKGFGSLGWTLVADTSPRQIVGLSGGLFNTFGNLAAITTPIVVGYLVSHTGSFDAALIYVGANAVLAVISYLFIVGRIQRIELDEPPGLAADRAVAASNLK